MIEHFRNYIGYYFIAAAILLIVAGEYFTGVLIGFVTVLKVPPFDWVGRAMDWSAGIGHRDGLKLKAWKEKQSKPVRILVTIIAAILVFLIWWNMPECELC